MFRWTLTNRFFGAAMFEYYATGKTIPKHAKLSVMGLISLMTMSSATFVWYISTLGDGVWSDPESWDGADPGYGAVTIIVIGMIGVWWLYAKVKTREYSAVHPGPANAVASPIGCPARFAEYRPRKFHSSAHPLKP